MFPRAYGSTKPPPSAASRYLPEYASKNDNTAPSIDQLKTLEEYYKLGIKKTQHIVQQPVYDEVSETFHDEDFVIETTDEELYGNIARALFPIIRGCPNSY